MAAVTIKKWDRDLETGMWDLGCETWDARMWDSGMRGRGTWDVGTWGRGNRGCRGVRGLCKQIKHDFCTEFVKYKY